MSAGSMIPQMAANDSSMAAAYSYTQMMTANNTGASSWGSSIDMSSMPSWSHSFIAENIMYTQLFLAANPEVVNKLSAVNMSSLASNPMALPQDISTLIQGSNNAASGTVANPSANATSAVSPASSSPSAASNVHSGAGVMTSSRVGVALVAVIAAAFAL